MKITTSISRVVLRLSPVSIHIPRWHLRRSSNSFYKERPAMHLEGCCLGELQ
jgi:hypothetical protein